jgi:beta-phosphoglucomutase
MSQWPRAVLFDFDGVIVNSEPLHFRAFQESLRAELIPLSEEVYYRELIGFDDRGGFRRVFEMHGRTLDPKTFQRVMANKSRMMIDLIRSWQYEALPGAQALVRGLLGTYPLAICSGALRNEIESMLEGVGLRDCFPVIVSAEDVTVGKPDPSGYLLSAKLLGEHAQRPLRPQDCLIVEDAPGVARSVRAVGFAVLAVTSSHPADRFGDANWIVPSLDPALVLKQIPHLKLNT